eukprot:CAMPEP_0117539382 /NCGR_PEP_ID=MMETSP0784-20121206/42956_1 /TAXON_ID=39447 /ORGANISM="" /LENGTH=641 /DNA_ID=CAMNT_0005336007 /DNA_START=10 /DNA_END=1935 /DNA_ORIENTATION=-
MTAAFTKSSPWHLGARIPTLERCCLPRGAGAPRCAAATDSFRYSSRDEERIVKTTLHEIGTQRADMKLSMKVYHFQELSRTSLSDRVLGRDSRFQNLKADLQEHAAELSPAQLVAAMVSSGRLRVVQQPFWWSLARGVERHTVKTASGAPGLQHSQICVALHSLGRANVKVKQRFYYRLLRFMLYNAELWTEFDMAWILYAMRKRRLKPVDETYHVHRLWAKVLKCIAAWFTVKINSISPRGAVFIMYEFARHEIYPGRVVFNAAKRIRQHMPALNDRALVALASLLAKLDWPERRLLKKLSEEAREPRRFVRMHPIMLVVILHAYAKLNVRDVALLEALCQLFARDCSKLDPRSRANLAYSLGRLGVRGPAWATLAARVEARIESHPPLHLALIAHAFGKAAVREEELLVGALADAAIAALPGFSSKHIACLLDGLTLADCFREDLFRAALEEYIRLGSVGGNRRNRIMSRVFFSLVLERPSFLVGVPPPWRTLIARSRPILQNDEESSSPRPYHEELASSACALGLPPRVRKCKGPYMADLHVIAPGRRSLAVHLVAEAEICPLTGDLLGPTRLKQRHLALMRWTYVGLNRKEWLALPDSSTRTDALEALLSRYIAIRRLPSGSVQVSPEDNASSQTDL